ncbi:DUF397 domain-containing protein [Streptomyces sp. NPDC087849]|uniref:DUF397 domain-containing protein n=1 Tax=Streptomyces sp. NPDC087849 TaxID=3365808 RepID=UPI00383035BC
MAFDRRKSSYSSNSGGQRTEITTRPRTVHARDSKAPDEPTLHGHLQRQVIAPHMGKQTVRGSARRRPVRPPVLPPAHPQQYLIHTT